MKTNNKDSKTVSKWIRYVESNLFGWLSKMMGKPDPRPNTDEENVQETK